MFAVCCSAEQHDGRISLQNIRPLPLQAPDGSRLSLEVCAVVACGAASALAPGAAAALEAAGLVVDGRLVVGARFETEDPAILAAGPMAKFSRWAWM